jgi:hypothetical protein
MVDEIILFICMNKGDFCYTFYFFRIIAMCWLCFHQNDQSSAHCSILSGETRINDIMLSSACHFRLTMIIVSYNCRFMPLKYRQHTLIIFFRLQFNGKMWETFNSEKVASLAYARNKGKSVLINSRTIV